MYLPLLFFHCTSFKLSNLLGSSSSGGGSGGRVGIYLSQPFGFRGTVAAFGGAGSPSGGPGTVYIEISDGVSVQRILKIDGRNRGETSALKVFLDEPGGYYSVLDKIELTNAAFVSLQQVCGPIYIFLDLH
jgi:hypothetical protein